MQQQGDSAAREEPKKRGFRPPNLQRTPKSAAAPHSIERFQSEVLGGRLWHAACQGAARGELFDQIPLEFTNVDDYIATFEPLVLEEAREGLKADWAESCAAGRVWAVKVCGVEEVAEGWVHVRLKGHGDHAALRQACQPNYAAVLSLGRPPLRGAPEWAQAEVEEGRASRESNERDAAGAKRPRIDDSQESGEVLPPQPERQRPGGALDSVPPCARVVAGLLLRSRDEEMVLKLHPGCARHGDAAEAPCRAVIQALREHPRQWFLAPAHQLISSEREYSAVHSMRSIDHTLLRHLLRPSLLQQIGAHYQDANVRRGMWPEHARRPRLIERLRAEYDSRQLEAIEMAACHLGAPDASANSGGGRLPTLPFVLIQGPPGTGKTHTVRGVLNIWHLVAFQRFYDELIRQALPAGAAGAALLPHAAAARAPELPPAAPLPQLNTLGSNVLEVLSKAIEAGGAGMAAGGAGMRVSTTAAADKPRILVCAPSNAACDELMSRIMSAGFYDGNGTMYRPNIVRIGADGASVSPAVRDRLLSRLVERYSTMAQDAWQHGYAASMHTLLQAGRELKALEMSLAREGNVAQAGRIAAKLVEVAQAAHKLARQVVKLDAAKPLVWGGARDPGAARRAVAQLEVALLEEAELVFSTLSASQRRGFAAVAHRVPFHTVLIDEAGQASEVAALQPLGYGARRVVLVGDPQQLPATVLSAAARAVALERSLFERLQKQGCPVVLLSMQYRMHPAIRAFPSRHFYQDRLEDAPSVRAAPPEPFHSHRLLQPYLLFDVSAGREQRGGGGGSMSNAAEAELAACLFMQLREALRDAAEARPPGAPLPLPTSVAVITPYREQRRVLAEAFEAVCGRQAAAEVAIETVDSFQGRQVDVVMLSCVRAGAGGGLGFVNDVRRMNVAITRARRSLWILGSVATLQGNSEWEALIKDAEERGVVIRNADASELFPQLQLWREEAAQRGGAGSGPGGDAPPPERQQRPLQQQQKQQQQQQQQQRRQQPQHQAGPGEPQQQQSRRRPPPAPDAWLEGPAPKSQYPAPPTRR